MDRYAPRGRRPHPIDLLMLLASFAVVAWRDCDAAVATSTAAHPRVGEPKIG